MGRKYIIILLIVSFLSFSSKVNFASTPLPSDKYFGEFLTKDLYLFLGTTSQYHLVAPQPFIIIGLFTLPRPKLEVPKQSSFAKENGIQQQTLFDV